MITLEVNQLVQPGSFIQLISTKSFFNLNTTNRLNTFFTDWEHKVCNASPSFLLPDNAKNWEITSGKCYNQAKCNHHLQFWSESFVFGIVSRGLENISTWRDTTDLQHSYSCACMTNPWTFLINENEMSL